MAISGIVQSMVCIASGGALGALCRYGIALGVEQWLMARQPLTQTTPAEMARLVPWGTFGANMLGCLLMGVLMVWAQQHTHDNSWLQKWMVWGVGVGFLGSLTTFSTWVNQSNNLMVQGLPWESVLNIAGSVLAGLCLLKLGIWLGEQCFNAIT